MFNTGDKVKKITDGKIGTIKDFVLTSNGTKYHVQFENGESVYFSEDILQEYQEIKTPLEAFLKFQFNVSED